MEKLLRVCFLSDVQSFFSSCSGKGTCLKLKSSVFKLQKEKNLNVLRGLESDKHGLDI